MLMSVSDKNLTNKNCLEQNQELLLKEDLRDILLLVFLRHPCLGPARLQLMTLYLAENLKVRREGQPKVTLIYVVVSAAV